MLDHAGRPELGAGRGQPSEVRSRWGGEGTSPTVVGRGAELAVLAEAVASVRAG
jgi:hypothetical protein